MVLMNATKKVRHSSSIMNQNSGGGPSKAGLIPSVGLTSWDVIARNARGLPLPLSNMRSNRSSKPANENLPIGLRYMKMR